MILRHPFFVFTRNIWCSAHLFPSLRRAVQPQFGATVLCHSCILIWSSIFVSTNVSLLLPSTKFFSLKPFRLSASDIIKDCPFCPLSRLWVLGSFNRDIVNPPLFPLHDTLAPFFSLPSFLDVFVCFGLWVNYSFPSFFSTIFVTEPHNHLPLLPPYPCSKLKLN